MTRETLQEICEAAGLAFTKPFGGVVVIDFGAVGAVIIDGRASSPQISAEEQPRQSTAGDNVAGKVRWRTTPATMMRAFDGERAFASAYVSGRIAIAGDMSVMARVQMESALF